MPIVRLHYFRLGTHSIFDNDEGMRGGGGQHIFYTLSIFWFKRFTTYFVNVLNKICDCMFFGLMQNHALEESVGLK